MSAPVKAHAAASEKTRHDLLAAGLRILETMPASAAFGHLTAGRISAEAGRTTGAFFHQWESIEAYLQDFAAYVLRPELAVNLGDSIQELDQMLQAGRSFAEALTQAGRGVPERTARDPQTVIELLMWNRALHDTEFRDRVAPLYRELDLGAAAVYQRLMQMLGREPRPPFTAESIGAVFNAVAQGMSIRASLTPDIYPDEAFGWLVLALIPAMTRRRGDRHDTAEWAASLPLDPPEVSDD